MIDYYLVYRFIKLLSTPFEKWPAFENGMIDKDGNILKSRKKAANEKERNSFTLFDLLVLNVKKVLSKLPGGSSKIATYAAVLYLLKENKLVEENTLNESVVSDINYYALLEEVKIVMEDEGVPANNVSSGNIAALGPGAEPFAKRFRKIVKRNEATEIDFDDQAAKRLTKQKKHKKLPRPTIPLA
jgi:hypothetical protein